MADYITTPLISEEMFIKNSPVTPGAAAGEFLPYISIAQELYIVPLLGEPVMEELKSQIEQNSLSAANSSLLVKVAPVLSFYSVYQALPFHWASIVNKGVTIRESENSKGVDINDIAQLRRWIKDDAEILSAQLLSFLDKYRSLYPLWRPYSGYSTASCGDRGNKKSFDSGFYFPRRD